MFMKFEGKEAKKCESFLSHNLGWQCKLQGGWGARVYGEGGFLTM